MSRIVQHQAQFAEALATLAFEVTKTQQRRCARGEERRLEFFLRPLHDFDRSSGAFERIHQLWPKLVRRSGRHGEKE